MNLYHVQDADCPMWVAAESLADAISRWEAHGRDEYGDADEVEPPQGAAYLRGLRVSSCLSGLGRDRGVAAHHRQADARA